MATGNNCFRYLDAQNKIDILQGMEDWEKDTTLVSWYIRVQDKEFKDFDIEDICRSIRQGFYVEYILPYAMKYLKGNVLAGEKYDGELLVALNSLRKEYPNKLNKYKKTIKSMIKDKIHTVEDEDIIKAANEWFNI
ncbi:MAG: contact-dependent growth inhibition system immunity protein [Anaerohalosphaeraceae bacterium]